MSFVAGDVAPESRVADYMRAWLLMQLPAAVDAINATRAPTLVAPRAGPYVIGSGLFMPLNQDGSNPQEIALTSGTRTAAEVADDLNVAIPGGWSVAASADSDGRLVLTGTAPTTGGAVRSLQVGPDIVGGIEQGLLRVFGWNPGGELSVRFPLGAPLGTGVCDGWPLLLDCGPGFWVIIGKRSSVPVQPGDIRRDSHLVALELNIMLKDTNIQNSRSREHVEACVQAVRRVLLTDRGRYLGRNGSGDVMKVEERTCVIPGSPWQARNEQGEVMGLFDVATLAVSVRIFERPAAS